MRNAHPRQGGRSGDDRQDVDRSVTPAADTDDSWPVRLAGQLEARQARRDRIAATRAEMKSRRDLGKRIGHARKLRGGERR